MLGTGILLSSLAPMGCSNKPNPVAPAPATTQDFVAAYSSDLPFARQTIVDTIRNGNISAEVSTFDVPIQAVTDADGNITGLPPGKYQVNVLANTEAYITCILATVGSNYIVLANEAIAATLQVGESFTYNGLKFQLGDLSVSGTAALINVLDSNGYSLVNANISQGQTQVFTIGGKSYPVHVYTVGAGYTFGEKWADLGIYDTMTQVQTATPYTAMDGSAYNFSMKWTGSQLGSWEFALKTQ